MIIEFPDGTVSYERFVNDLSTEIVQKLKENERMPEFISQRKAFKLFGRANVERWRRTGKISPRIRPGRMDYNVMELKRLQNIQQDYQKDK